MLTRLQVRNFKCLEDATLGLQPVTLLVGPAGAGKTSALQALVLWHAGLRRWGERRPDGRGPEQRPGVTLHRSDIPAIPVPSALMLWHDLRASRVADRDGRSRTENIRLELTVDGLSPQGVPWSCGLEFDYGGEESVYCRPLRVGPGDPPERLPIPAAAGAVRLAYLSPGSRLSTSEPLQSPERIDWLIAAGLAEQVVRNLCHQLARGEDDAGRWESLVGDLYTCFGVELRAPERLEGRGELIMTHREAGGTVLEVCCAGRGLQQAILLLAYIYARPGSVILVDDPGACLEPGLQRRIHRLLTRAAAAQGSQLIVADQTGVLLEEAAGRCAVVAFTGAPGHIDGGGDAALRALREMGLDLYCRTQASDWVLYLERPSDLESLRELAAVLGHEAQEALREPFVHYVGHSPEEAARHFSGLKQIRPDLKGLALFSHLEGPLPDVPGIKFLAWDKGGPADCLRCPGTLLAYARSGLPDDLFGRPETARREEIMRQCIQGAQETAAAADLGTASDSPADRPADGAAGDEAEGNEARSEDAARCDLDAVMAAYHRALDLPNPFSDGDCHKLFRYLPPERMPDELVAGLDAIAALARHAKPVR